MPCHATLLAVEEVAFYVSVHLTQLQDCCKIKNRHALQLGGKRDVVNNVAHRDESLL